jgi:hypothetical protein
LRPRIGHCRATSGRSRRGRPWRQTRRLTPRGNPAQELAKGLWRVPGTRITA